MALSPGPTSLPQAPGTVIWDLVPRRVTCPLTRDIWRCRTSPKPWVCLDQGTKQKAGQAVTSECSQLGGEQEVRGSQTQTLPRAGEVGEGSGHEDNQSPDSGLEENLASELERFLLLYSLLCCCDEKQASCGGRVYFSLYTSCSQPTTERH